jgi:hypothetical protein
LLLLVTVLSFVLHGDPHLQAKLVDSALAQFPVVSSQLREKCMHVRLNTPHTSRVPLSTWLTKYVPSNTPRLYRRRAPHF